MSSATLPTSENEVSPSRQSTRLPVIHALTNSRLIKRDGNELVFTFGQSEKTLPVELVAAVHPLIPDVVDFINIRAPHKSGQLLRRTLKHWQEPGIKLEHDGSTYYVTLLTDVLMNTETDDFSVMIKRYKTVVHDDGYEVAVGVWKKMSVTVSREWLNKSYDGLAIKVEMLLALGGAPKEVSNEALLGVFVATSDQEMFDITFD